MRELEIEATFDNYIDMKKYNAIARLFRPGVDLDPYVQLNDQVSTL
jgi:hypothetical protein